MLKLKTMTKKAKNSRPTKPSVTRKSNRGDPKGRLSQRIPSFKIPILIAGLMLLLGLGLSIVMRAQAGRNGLIVIPAAPSCSRSWEPFLKELAQKTRLDSIRIETWATADELDLLLAASRKKHIIFAEVPVGYDLLRLSNKSLIEPLPSTLLNDSNLYPGFIQSLKIKNDSGKIYGLPFTFDPWMSISRTKQKPALRPAAVLAIPGKDDSGAAAAFGLGLALAGGEMTSERSLSILADLQGKGFFEHSAFTYNTSDSYAYFRDGHAASAFLPMTFFRTIPTQDLLDLEVGPLPPLGTRTTTDLVANGTVIVFPSETHITAESLKLLIATLSDPDLIYGISKSRDLLPAATNTKVRDYHADNVRTMARNARSFIFPELYMGGEASRPKLIDDIKQVLVSR